MFSKPMNVAIEAALKAGKHLLRSYGKLNSSQIHTKSKNDFVTELDKQSEDIVIGTLKKSFPGDKILAEESGMGSGDGRLWIIDPLDGTSNYIHQFPMFCVSIGAMEDKKLRYAVIYDPVHNELFCAEKGKGAFLNKKRIHVTKVPKLADAMIATGIPFRARARFEEYLATFRQVSMGSVGMRRGGSAALDLAYVACGRFEGFWEIDLSPWDIAAGALLIEEAGGKVTDMWGKNLYMETGDVLGSNSKIHRELQAITSKTFTHLDVNKLCV